MIKLNKHTYTILIEGDVEWLRRQPNTLERQHIEVVLYDSIKRLYPDSNDENVAEYSQAAVAAHDSENEIVETEAGYLLGAELLTEERQERTAWCKYWCEVNNMQFIKLTADGERFNVYDPKQAVEHIETYEFSQYNYQEEIGKYDDDRTST